MLQRYRVHVWGVLLVVGGMAILLFNLGVFDRLRPGLEYGIASATGALGLSFLAYYAYNRTQWWPALPGLTLLGAGLTIYLGTRAALHNETLAGLLFLALAIAFAIVYGTDRRNWWAIIPGGILLVIGLLVLLSQRLPFELLGVLLFVGIGLVFFLVYLLGPAKREVWWALIPGTALVLSGLVTYSLTVGRGQPLAQFWPLVPIAFGLFLLGRELAKSRVAQVGLFPSSPSDQPEEGMPASQEPATAQMRPSIATAASPLSAVFGLEGPSDHVPPDS